MAKLKFTIEFSIDESWIADGYFLTSENAKALLMPSWAHGAEASAKVIKTPDLKRVAKLQGYDTVKAFKASMA